jgi:hypothetical protein
LLSSTTTQQQLVKPLADSFVSYAWKYTFKDLITALMNGNGDLDRFVWIDAFVVNQHVRNNVNQKQWLETFRGALKEIGHAELVLIPWKFEQLLHLLTFDIS